MSTLCPVCGYDLGFPPWEGESPSDEICPSCGIQFGYVDHASGDLGQRMRVYEERRRRWIANGTKWWSTGRSQPDDWDAVEQLGRSNSLVMVPEFFLASTESYGFEMPRRAVPVKRVSGEHRDDYLLIRVSPPVIGQPFGLGGTDIELLIVATRHKGVSLFPIREWPVHVHIARVLVPDPQEREILHRSELEVIAWGELYPSEQAALRKASE